MTTVTVFGSCNMDLVAYVPRAPQRGETVHGREFQTVPGGKGANQAIAAAQAGAATTMIAAVGTDEFGAEIGGKLRECGVDTRGVREVVGRSGTAHIVVDDEGGNSIVVVASANSALDRLAPGDEELIAASHSLLLQLETPLEGIARAAAVARANGVRVVLTPAPAGEIPAELLSDVDVLVPNEHEAAVLSGVQEPRAALPVLLDSVGEVVITCGSRGVLYGNRAGERIEVPAYPVTAVDTTAAGDTFVGVLSAELGDGIGMRHALTRACAASALSVQRNGASSSMPARHEIDQFLSEHANG